MEKEKIKVSANGTQFVRFDIELTQEQFNALDNLCAQCYRSRKNFAEALVLLAIDGKLDLSKLGIVK